MQISKRLKLPYNTVQKYCRLPRSRSCRSQENLKKKARRKPNLKITPSEEQKIVDASKANPFKTATEIHREVELTNPVSVRTIRNVLIKNGLRAFHIDKKLVRTTQN